MVFTTSSCATVQSGFTLQEGHELIDAPISIVDVYLDEHPIWEYRIQARLDAHFEKTYFMNSAFEEALEELKIQARLSGSQAIMNIKESKSRVGETKIYHVTATGIRYVD